MHWLRQICTQMSRQRGDGHSPDEMPDLIQETDALDGQLLGQYLDQKSSQALEHLVRRHIDLVYSAARRQVHDTHLAEDIAQDVFLVLIKKAPSLRDHRNLGGWLFQTTLLTSRNAMRGKSREAARLNQLGQQTPQQDHPMPTHAWEHMEPHVNAALESLSDSEREAVVLRYFQKHPYARVAAALGMTEDAARQRVHRGLEHMRQFLRDNGVVAGAAELSAAIRLHGVQPAPAHLRAPTLSAIGKTQARLAAAKGTVTLLAALKAKGMAAALILLSIGLCAGAAVLIVKHRAKGEAIYLDVPANQPIAANTLGFKPPRIATRPPFQLIRAVSHDESKGTKDWAGFVGYINKGDWLRFNRVDLGPGAGVTLFSAIVCCPDQYAGNVILVHQDRLDGPVIATLKIQSTGSYGNWKSQSTPISAAGGVHDLFLEFSGGGWNIDTFRITLASRPALQLIPALTFNDSLGVQTRAGVVSETSDGQWVRYNGIEFGTGLHAVAITYSCDNANAGGTITMRLDRLDARPAAKLDVKGTGGWGRYQAAVVPVDVNGTHDVILTFNGHWHSIANLLSIQFLPEVPVREVPPGSPATQPTSRPATQPAATRPSIFEL
jgi:RNA polymerase sigma factor (sigma-70 family)